jgi:hypothetical protein
MDENNLFDLTEIIPYKTSYFVLLLELKRRREVLNIQDQSIEILDKVADD